ncbi:MAG TPA: alpha-amylase family glycosyl hydrolase [Streptosporangiaceae bacterium]
MNSWAEHAILWHVYPLGFTGAEQVALPVAEPVRHRLPHLAGWLDYAVELGCSGLLLGPVFAAETHGYDTVDHFRIDPRLGDETDFDGLVASAGQRGLRIILDGVFNHVGRSFGRREWWRRDPAGGFATFEGHEQLVALDHSNPAVADYVGRVMTHWLERGVAGWRLDAAYAVPPSFWREVLPKVRAAFPEAWFAGEMIHGDYPAYAADAGLDSVTQYELWKSIWSSLNDRNFFELAWTLDRHNEFLDGVPGLQTFVGNHDVTRLASQLTDIRHLGHALAVLFTVGGIPSVYYGDEQAFRGIKENRSEGDDAIRPSFPATPALLWPDGWPVYRLHQRLIGFRRRHPWLVRARTDAVHLSNSAIAYRSIAGGAAITVLLNVGEEPFRFPVDVRGLDVAMTPDPGTVLADPAVVSAHSWMILS